MLAARVAAESKILGPDVVVARSPHFYVVTNANKRIKLITRRGTRRLMTAHEVLHLTLQRCELAYDDFVHWFGGEVKLQKPMAVYVVASDADRRAVGKRYFGGEEIHMNYAFAYNNRIADGFSGNGFVVCLQHEGSDRNMHGFLRHQIGHILFSCWQVQGGFEEECPRWAWVGAAHFLEKLPPLLHDYATFCYGEAAGGVGPRTRWADRVRKLAAHKLEPIETFFNKTSLSAMKYDDHLRAWSIMDLMLREDRTRWLKVLARLRHKEVEGKAFQAELGIKPDAFNQRWVDRVLGRRKSMGQARVVDAPDADPRLRERRRIENTQDPEVVAGLVRGLDKIRDVETLLSVMRRMDDPSDLVRESIHLVLARSTAPAVRTFVREQALQDKRPLVRAGAARVLGLWGDKTARKPLELLLQDSYWLARANAAQALARLGDPAAKPALLAALDERKDKPWIAIADAFASFPGRSREATEKIAARLGNRHWQVRLTAARALAVVGTMEAMDPLIAQFAREGGTLKKEMYAALRKVSRDDLGPKPDVWRVWWEGQKKKHGGALPPPPPRGPAPTTGSSRYAKPERPDRDDPHYYGRRVFSRSVCFVLDTSASMDLEMKVRPDEIHRLGDLPAQGTRMDIARKALLDALGRLDARTRVRLVFFNTRVKLWKNDLQPVGGANLDSMRSTLRNLRAQGETNFYGALKAALGLYGKPTLDPDLGNIPDTVYFLTDGRPTKGEITAMPELISWFEGLERFAKVRLHIIALGELNVDVPSLRKLAAAGGGDVVYVREQ
jgi:Mg-chelatase subunit ChlD